MKISTKGRYALWLMIDLAEHYEDGYISIKSISTRKGISDKYLEQIIKMLVDANLVESKRGKQGGYHLTKAPKDYSVGEILRVTEGSLAPVSCLEDESLCGSCGDCMIMELGARILKAVNEVVDAVTLEEITLQQQKKKCDRMMPPKKGEGK